MTENEKEIKQQELEEQAAHQSLVMDIQQVLSTKAGKGFVKYLFGALAVAEACPIGMNQEYMREYIGHQRAGVAVFDIVAEANPELAGTILGQLQKEKYAQKIFETRRGN